MRPKAFCEHCREYNYYTVKEEVSVADIKNISGLYMEKKCYCDNCKNEIFVDEIMDENLNRIQIVLNNSK